LISTVAVLIVIAAVTAAMGLIQGDPILPSMGRYITTLILVISCIPLLALVIFASWKNVRIGIRQTAEIHRLIVFPFGSRTSLSNSRSAAMMNIRFFSDLIDVLGKVAGGLKDIANIPKAELDAMRGTLDEIYQVIDATLSMVIIRLGDILLRTSDTDFLGEAARLDNHQDWMNAERTLRLCRSPRTTLRETDTLRARLAGNVSTKDWNALLQQIEGILTTEYEVAMFISQQFDRIASEARSAGGDPARAQSVREAMATFRTVLLSERQALIRQELDIHALI